MSDALILGIVIPVITAVSAWVTIWLNGRVAAKLKSQIVETNLKLNTVESKLDENHRQQNGNLTKLLETTKELATAKERARGENEKK